VTIGRRSGASSAVGPRCQCRAWCAKRRQHRLIRLKGAAAGLQLALGLRFNFGFGFGLGVKLGFEFGFGFRLGVKLGFGVYVGGGFP
jgi:hypothetical protein